MNAAPKADTTALPATVDIATTQLPLVKNGDPALDAPCVENVNNRYHSNRTAEAMLPFEENVGAFIPSFVGMPKIPPMAPKAGGAPLHTRM